MVAISLTSCTSYAFQASPRTVFPPGEHVEAKCETYGGIEDMSAHVAWAATQGWRVMNPGVMDTCFILCWHSPIVCYERVASTSASGAQPPPAPPAPLGRDCMGDASCNTGEKCVFAEHGGAFAKGHCAPAK